MYIAFIHKAKTVLTYRAADVCLCLLKYNLLADAIMFAQSTEEDNPITGIKENIISIEARATFICK